MACVTCKVDEGIAIPALRVTQSLRVYWMLRCVTSQRLRCHYEAVSTGLFRDGSHNPPFPQKNQGKISISLRMRTNPYFVLQTKIRLC